MTDRNEKAKRVLDNSTKVIAGIGVIAVLFAIWFSIQFAKSKTKKEFDSRQTYFNAIHQNFNKTWSENAYWDIAVDPNTGRLRDTGFCPICKAELTKRAMKRIFSINQGQADKYDQPKLSSLARFWINSASGGMDFVLVMRSRIYS